MRKQILIISTAIWPAVAGAAFIADIDKVEIIKRMGTLTVNDLAVGESGYINAWAGLCKNENGAINLNKYTELETDRSSYGSYLKVKRQPQGMVAIESTGTKRKDKKAIMTRVAASASERKECDGEFFIVDSIDGASSVSELLDIALADNVAVIEPKSTATPIVESYLTDAEDNHEQKWIVDEDKSPIDDSPEVTMMLPANEEAAGAYGSKDRPTFIIRCKENSTEAYFSIGSRLENETVTVRLDSDKAYSIEMDKSTNGKAVFFPQAISNVKKLFNREKMTFRYTPTYSGKQTVTFNINGLEAEITPLREACHW